jgi:hypothetical protein
LHAPLLRYAAKNQFVRKEAEHEKGFENVHMANTHLDLGELLVFFKTMRITPRWLSVDAVKSLFFSYVRRRVVSWCQCAHAVVVVIVPIADVMCSLCGSRHVSIPVQTRSRNTLLSGGSWEEKEKDSNLLNFGDFLQVLCLVADAIEYADQPGPSKQQKIVWFMRLLHSAAADPKLDTTLKQLQPLAQPQLAASSARGASKASGASPTKLRAVSPTLLRAALPSVKVADGSSFSVQLGPRLSSTASATASAAVSEPVPIACPWDLDQVIASFRNGVLLCQLVQSLTRTFLAHVEATPRTRAAAVQNIDSALTKLRGVATHRRRLKLTYLYAPADLHAAHSSVWWALLDHLCFAFDAELRKWGYVGRPKRATSAPRSVSASAAATSEAETPPSVTSPVPIVPSVQWQKSRAELVQSPPSVNVPRRVESPARTTRPTSARASPSRTRTIVPPRMVDPMFSPKSRERPRSSPQRPFRRMAAEDIIPHQAAPSVSIAESAAAGPLRPTSPARVMPSARSFVHVWLQSLGHAELIPPLPSVTPAPALSAASTDRVTLRQRVSSTLAKLDQHAHVVLSPDCPPTMPPTAPLPLRSTSAPSKTGPDDVAPVGEDVSEARSNGSGSKPPSVVVRTETAAQYAARVSVSAALTKAVRRPSAIDRTALAETELRVRQWWATLPLSVGIRPLLAGVASKAAGSMVDPVAMTSPPSLLTDTLRNGTAWVALVQHLLVTFPNPLSKPIVSIPAPKTTSPRLAQNPDARVFAGVVLRPRTLAHVRANFAAVGAGLVKLGVAVPATLLAFAFPSKASQPNQPPPPSRWSILVDQILAGNEDVLWGFLEHISKAMSRRSQSTAMHADADAAMARVALAYSLLPTTLDHNARGHPLSSSSSLAVPGFAPHDVTRFIEVVETCVLAWVNAHLTSRALVQRPRQLMSPSAAGALPSPQLHSITELLERLGMCLVEWRVHDADVGQSHSCE